MNSELLGKSWNLSQKGLEIITENGTIKDKSQILQNALNTDLKEIAAGVLSKDQSKHSLTNVILQIQKIRNISAPKANEYSQTAPRMLKIVLTDGETYIQAIEITPITSISRDKTPPGTKILINNAKIQFGYLLLNSNCFTVLGGHVAHMYEKWETSKSLHFSQNRQNYSSSDGPPVWVNFGSKINRSIDNEEFKSLDSGKSNGNKENSEFELQRKELIAEASTGAIKKTFGGNIKQPVQNNKFIRNNNRDNRRNNQKTRNFSKEIDEKPQKPSEKVSLFDFLENKLPIETNNDNKKFSNNQMNNLNENFGKFQINENSTINWKVGDECLAKYWEDKKFYNALITAITDKTCVVKFKGYGNVEEILKNDCLPVKKPQKDSYGGANRRPGSMEFKRNAKFVRK